MTLAMKSPYATCMPVRFPNKAWEKSNEFAKASQYESFLPDNFCGPM